MKSTISRKQSPGLAKQLALAVMLASGTALVGTFGFAEPAYAQKKKKQEEEAKPVYSKEFVAAYQPIDEALKVEGADVNALRPKLAELQQLTVSPDEQVATGGLTYNAGLMAEDRALQLQGIETMLASGKVSADQTGRYNFIAFTIANQHEEFPKARKFLQAAIDANFTTDTISAADLQLTMAESYFAANEIATGLDYLDRAIKSRKDAGLPVEAQWYRRGITVAYNNKTVPQVYDFVTAWIKDYPSAENWRDAVNVTRNLNTFSDPQMLDLLRLAHRAGVLTEKQDYILYIETADPRRLPKEVKDLIDKAYSDGAISQDDIFIADSLSTANSRIASDRADLPALESDASASDAKLRTVTAAGDAFLSYGDFAKAVRFYQKSLDMAGVDQAEVLTRLGIAQIGLGDFNAASDTFDKIEGQRAPIARLWAAYANEKSGAPSTGG